MNELTPDQLDALREYASANGRTWKSKLHDEWMNATSIGAVYALRNTHGPSWLVRFSLKKALAEASSC